ncbi:MAG TPA: hypothetical protein VF809_02715 [Candidatus Saccharimonadales bacterium]
MPQVPEWFRPVIDTDAIDLEAIDRQFDAAQTGYDPSGADYQLCSLNWVFTLLRDTRGLPLPAEYRQEETRLTAIASVREPGRNIDVAVGVETPDRKDIYRAGRIEDIPMMVRLLGSMACVELAEFEVRPRSALDVLARFDPIQYMACEHQVVQKTYDPAGTETEAVHLSLIREGELVTAGSPVAYHINYGRPLAIGSDRYTYWQYFSSKDGAGNLRRHPRAFHEVDPLPLGRHYDPRRHGFELSDDPRAADFYPDEMSFSSFERMLKTAGNIFVGNMTGYDVNRLVGEPLEASHRLHLPSLAIEDCMRV